MRKRCILLFSLLFCTPLLAGAADPESLAATYRLAHDADPVFRAAAAAHRAALEARPQALAGLLPTIGLKGDYSRNRYDNRNPQQGKANPTYSTNQSYSLALSQPLFHWDRWVQLRQADSRIRQAEARFSAAEQDLILRVAQRYFDVLAAQDNLDFARAEKTAIARQREQAQQRFDVGLIAITDVREARARYDLAVTQEIQAQDRLDSAREALREIIGRMPEALVPLQGSVPLVRPDPADVDAWVRAAMKGNLALRAAQAALDSARQEVKRQRAGHYPTLDLTASYSYLDNNFGGVFPLERNDASIGVELNLPLFTGGLTSSRVREALAKYQQALEELQRQRRAVVRQTRDAYRGVNTQIRQVKALEQALKSTETALEAAKAGFDVGTRTIVDVLDAQREWHRSRRDLARARYDYILNSLRLKQAAGTLAPADIERVSHWLGTRTATGRAKTAARRG